MGTQHDQSDEHSCRDSKCKTQLLKPGEIVARATAPVNAARAATQASVQAWHKEHGIEHERKCQSRQGEGRGGYKRDSKKKRVRARAR